MSDTSLKTPRIPAYSAPFAEEWDSPTTTRCHSGLAEKWMPRPYLVASRRAVAPTARRLRDQFALKTRQCAHVAPDIRLDTEMFREIARVYDQAPAVDTHDPQLPGALNAAAMEVEQSFTEICRSGCFTIEFQSSDPYRNSYDAMLVDVTVHRRLKVYTGGEVHPLWNSRSPSSVVDINMMFRAVHDLWGHCADGNGFDAAGEEAAFFSHSLTFSPVAIRYIATEARAQNAWFHFGPHLFDSDGWRGHPQHPRYLPPSERPYPLQKVFLLPEELCR